MSVVIGDNEGGGVGGVEMNIGRKNDEIVKYVAYSHSHHTKFYLRLRSFMPNAEKRVASMDKRTTWLSQRLRDS